MFSVGHHKNRSPWNTYVARCPTLIHMAFVRSWSWREVTVRGGLDRRHAADHTHGLASIFLTAPALWDNIFPPTTLPAHRVLKTCEHGDTLPGPTWLQ